MGRNRAKCGIVTAVGIDDTVVPRIGFVVGTSVAVASGRLVGVGNGALVGLVPTC